MNFGARIAAEIDRMPLITVQLQPVAFLGVQEMPLMRAGMEWTLSLPLFLKKALMRFGVWHADRLLAGGINAVRRRHGLGEPVHSVMGRWWLSPDAVLGMFPEWFARPQPDWPPQVRLCRFPLNDEADVRAPEPELEQFLREGSPPLLFTPGLANAHAAAFFREAAKVCARLGRRGVFLSRFPEQIPPGLPPTVRHFHYIPFSQVFPRCAAVIHHGGIGTCAQGLAAGVPQLVNALSHDQPDNGLRLKRLGVGDYLYARHFAAARVAPLLRRLLDSPDAAVACARVRDLMRTQMSPEGTGALIERLVRPR